jgi:hypothetical protein
MARPIPGFHLFNITDKIHATDIAAWFSYWLSVQEFTWNSTIIHAANNTLATPSLVAKFVDVTISILILAAPLIAAVLIRDWWGLVNAIFKALLVLIQSFLLRELRGGIAASLQKAHHKPGAQARKRLLVITSDGKAISFFAPCGIVTEAFLTNPRVAHPIMCEITRGLAWALFGCHVVSLGRTSLICQIINIMILLFSTLLFVHHVGSQVCHWRRN